MVITIARECGCEGDEVGRKLSGQYGIPCYSKKELVELAKEKNIYEKYPFYFGERPIDDMMSSIAGDVQDKVREKLYTLEGMLPVESFMRASKSAILNLNKVKSLSPAFGGRFEAVLDNGEKTIISRQYVPVLKERLGL